MSAAAACVRSLGQVDGSENVTATLSPIAALTCVLAPTPAVRLKLCTSEV